MSNDDVHGLQAARKLLAATRAQMKGASNSDPYARGWRAGLRELDNLIAIRIADIKVQR